MGTLNKKVAVVTGASSGIGEAVAIRLAKEGAKVVLLARRVNRLKQVSKKIEELGGESFVFNVDLCDQEALIKTAQEIKKMFSAVDILVNNAGAGTGGAVCDTSVDEYEWMFNLNVRALYLMTKEMLPKMIEKKDGFIINIGSIAGKKGIPYISLYCASKFAVTGFTEALLEEVREHNIKVSLICPGLVDTEFHSNRKVPTSGDIKDYIQSEDIADAVMLCTSASNTATFKEIVVRPRRPVQY